ncbi:hypothetical protein NA57DRAFT_78622 [Rhizodiscina lignyota]|uniref:Protein LOT5 n=1 Tax=Rhizodiscina lignyota TaxID=1504668 RepID=A0A9P4M3L5_9PEZI|nr:hypothetical protein NA57DRAFT_78622 [Rhizodiscina lignyota]
MDIESITSAPSLDDFTPLDDHQSQTPSTFFGGKPVLHLCCPNSRVILQDANSVESLGSLLGAAESSAQATGTADGANVNGANANGEHAHLPQALLGIDVYVCSDAIILYSTATSKGLKLVYPSIALCAISTVTIPDSSTASTSTPETAKGLYMQLNLYDMDTTNSEEDIRTGEVAILPQSSSTTATAATETPTAVEQSAHISIASMTKEEATNALFEAVCACQELHPDAMDEDDEDGVGSVPVIGTSGAPGDGGWITSENMAQFMDENGNFVGFGGAAGGDDAVIELGPGAGTVRPREEESNAGEGEEDDERFKGHEDGREGEERGETKWQRTG